MVLDLDQALATVVAECMPPSDTSSPRAFVVLYGAPCTGKTTVGKELSRLLDAHRISTDLLRAKFVPAHLPEKQRYDPKVNVELFELLARSSSRVLAQGISVVCEAMMIDPSRVVRLSLVAAETSTIAHTFFLTAPLRELKRRLISREKHGVNSEGLPEANIRIAELVRLNRLCAPHAGTFRTFDTHQALSSEIARAIVKIVRPDQRVSSHE